MRLVSSENEEREVGMAGSGSVCSSTLSEQAPGTKRGVSNSSVPSLAAAMSFKEPRVLQKEPVSRPPDAMETASSLAVSQSLESRLLRDRARSVLTDREGGGGIDKLAWSAWTSVRPASECLPFCASELLRTEENDEVREGAGPPWLFEFVSCWSGLSSLGGGVLPAGGVCGGSVCAMVNYEYRPPGAGDDSS